MDTEIKHSFVIPAYKDSVYLEDCVKSLINQSYPSSIHITTSTPSINIELIAKKYQLSYHVSNAPSSISGDWNFALSCATTQFVTIAHQDDIYHPNYSKLVIEQIKKNISAQIIFTNYSDLIQSSERKWSTNSVIKAILLWPFMFSNKVSHKLFKKSCLVFGDPICCPSVVYNLKKIEGFSFSKKFDCVLDWAAWWELAQKNGSFVYIKKKLLYHRIHLNSETTNQINTGGRQIEEKKMLTKIWGSFFGSIIAKIYHYGIKANMH